jgi:DNA helicase-2/ATP-dependent DNA helicase PcrA
VHVGTEERREPVESVLLADLDDAQRRAVTTASTLVAVIAAAGSGKTRVLTRRIAHRVAIGTADARATLALTFTREAAGELRRRLRRIGQREAVEAGTFHAIARSLLRQRWQEQGRPLPAVVDDRDRLLRELRSGIPVAALGTEIGWAAAHGIDADGYVAAARQAQRRPSAPLADVAAAMARYQQLKHRRGVVDLDDLLTLARRELTQDALWAEAVRFRYRHVLVDEAQDLNPVQFGLLRELVGDRRDLFLVGDPTQSIYAFNGSDPALLADVEQHFPGVEIVRLPVNHRSIPAVVDAGMHVLRTSGQAADAVAAREDGPPVAIHAAADAPAEAELVARLARDLDPGVVGRGDVGVVARTNAQLPALAAALEAAGLPVRRDAITPGSPLALAVRAAATLPSASRLRAWAHDVTEDEAAEAEAAELAAQRRVAGAVLEFLRDHPGGDGASFRAWIATTNPFSSGPGSGGIEVLTFHGAKGREWQTVFVTGVETGLVPHRSATTGEAKAEEARLLHVALTRARDELIVTWARRRGGYARRPSPLLEGLESAPADVVAPPTPLRRGRPRTDDRRERLRRWRDETARAAGTLPETICTDAELDAIAVARPAGASALAEVTGFGLLTASRLYPGIRDALDR